MFVRTVVFEFFACLMSRRICKPGYVDVHTLGIRGLQIDSQDAVGAEGMLMAALLRQFVRPSTVHVC